MAADGPNQTEVVQRKVVQTFPGRGSKGRSALGWARGPSSACSVARATGVSLAFLGSSSPLGEEPGSASGDFVPRWTAINAS
jgi:hypothetical protein